MKKGDSLFDMIESPKFTTLRTNASQLIDAGFDVVLNQANEAIDKAESLPNMLDSIAAIINLSTSGTEQAFQQFSDDAFIHGYNTAFGEVGADYVVANVYIENGIFDSTKRAIKRAGERTKETVKSVSDRTKSAAKRSINAIRSNVKKLIKTILPKYKTGSQFTPEQTKVVKEIAKRVVEEQLSKLDKQTKQEIQDEITRAAADGKVGAYEDAGIKQVKARIDTVKDERRCKKCADLEGKIVPIEQAKSLIPLHPNCVKPKTTEVFTRDGWKWMEDLTTDDYCLSENPETGLCEFVRVSYVISDDYSGDYVYLNHKWLHQEFTVDHNCYVVYSFDYGDYVKKQYSIVKHIQKKRDYEVPITARLIKSEHYERKQIGDIDVPFDAYVRLMAYFLSNGRCAKKRGDEESYQISLVSQDADEQTRMMNDLLPFTDSAVLQYDKKGIQVVSNELGRFLYQYSRAKTRRVPDDILYSSYAKIFLDAYAYQNRQNLYCTTNELLRDNLTYLILKAGKGLSIQRMELENKPALHILTALDFTSAHSDQIKEKREYYRGRIHCVELEKNHTLFVKQRGFCSWIGNCRCMWKLVSPDYATKKQRHEERKQVKKINRLRDRLDQNYRKKLTEKGTKAVHNASWFGAIPDLTDAPEALESAFSLDLNNQSYISPYHLTIQSNRLKKRETGLTLFYRDTDVEDGKLKAGSVLKLLGRRGRNICFDCIGNLLEETEREKWEKENRKYGVNAVSLLPESISEYPYELYQDGKVSVIMDNPNTGHIESLGLKSGAESLEYFLTTLFA